MGAGEAPMSNALQHRTVLVGVDADLESSLRQALRARQASPAAVCLDLEAARQEALLHPGAAHLFLVPLGGEGELAALSEFTAALPGQPVVALLPPGATVPMVLAAQRAGAAQVVPLPLRQDDLL